jgi:uncharacterized protein YggU (UPF0235/DUF167 family)
VAQDVTRLTLRVVPGAPRAGVVGRHGAAWKIRVAAAPERGAANDAVRGLLADALSVGRRDVRIVSGHAARDKIVEVQGIPPDETEARLTAAQRKESRR